LTWHFLFILVTCNKKQITIITDINELDFSKKYTYADYVKWQFDEMVELIHGKIYGMSSVPNWEHQRVSGRLHTLINIFGTLTNPVF